MPVDVDTLRKLMRGMRLWFEVYQETGLYVIEWEGESWCYHDLVYLYEVAQTELPRRQAQAIRYFLVDQLPEVEVAVMMGIKPTNPIGMYATAGLEQLVALVNDGLLPRFRAESPHGEDEVWRTQGARRGSERLAEAEFVRRHVA